ncbi:MAG: protein-tyrosine phosphatase-like protein [Monoraphidium minutum]|nr:MAG: protein-tyrosine phosphatase-like protein [Monoraphidium minutum]
MGAQHSQAQQRLLQQTAAAGAGAGGAASAQLGGMQPPRAINLRDLGEAAPGVLRPRSLYRCSQVFSRDVVRELGVRTVVDLRGRSERQISKAQRGAAAGAAPPPLLGTDELDRLQGPGAAPAALEGVGASEFEAGIVAVPRAASAASLGGASLKSSGDGGGKDEEGAAAADALMGLGGPEAAAAAAAAAAAGAGGGGMLETVNFNLIPAKEFGLQMLRMPRRVWLDSFGRLLTLRDPRKPFVEAFADEQLLGFTRYYTLILEHSKASLAGVLRVFGQPGALPALVHCAHGKDRTGVVIMLLLAACGVPQEAIVDDYIESERQLRAYRESLGLPPALWASGAPIPLSDVIIASTQETMRAMLIYLEERYPQGVDAYLRSCGLEEAEIWAIRRELMTPPAFAALEAAATSSGGAVPWRHAPAAGAPAGAAAEAEAAGVAEGGEARVRAAVEEAKAAAAGGGGGSSL